MSTFQYLFMEKNVLHNFLNWITYCTIFWINFNKFQWVLMNCRPNPVKMLRRLFLLPSRLGLFHTAEHFFLYFERKCVLLNGHSDCEFRSLLCVFHSIHSAANTCLSVSLNMHCKPNHVIYYEWNPLGNISSWDTH